jgi:hypothetical protein
MEAITMRTTLLVALLGVVAVGGTMLGQSKVQAVDPAVTFYDILVRSAIHQPQDGDPAQAYVNGIPCGDGIVDAANPSTRIFNPIFTVPETCAPAGATVAFTVNGYMLADTAIAAPTNDFISVSFKTRLGPVPNARYAGFTSLALGSTIEARIGNTVCGTGTVLPLGNTLRFFRVAVTPSLPAPFGTLGCGFPGANVSFWAGGIQVGSGSWSSGFTFLNL